MKKKIILFVAGIIAIFSVIKAIQLTKDVATDILNSDDDLEF